MLSKENETFLIETTKITAKSGKCFKRNEISNAVMPAESSKPVFLIKDTRSIIDSEKSSHCTFEDSKVLLCFKRGNAKGRLDEQTGNNLECGQDRNNMTHKPVNSCRKKRLLS